MTQKGFFNEKASFRPWVKRGFYDVKRGCGQKGLVSPMGETRQCPREVIFERFCFVVGLFYSFAALFAIKHIHEFISQNRLNPASQFHIGFSINSVAAILIKYFSFKFYGATFTV